MKKISVVIPALNESKGIFNTVSSIPKDNLRQMGYETQIIVVDNGSTDETSKIASEAGAEVIFESVKGYGSAFKAGFNHASGDIIATTDADDTYPVESIPELLKILLAEDLDFITTDRLSRLEKKAMSLRNRVGNYILSLVMRVLFQIDIKDSQSGMWVFRKNILGNLIIKSNTPLSQEIKIEACSLAKYRWKEIPINYRVRRGKAKLGGWKVGTQNLVHLFLKRIRR